MFSAEYSRLKFWIWSIVLMILNVPVIVISNAPVGDIQDTNITTIVLIIIILSLPSIIWINVLANRIRDYGSNPWLSLWSLIPLVNIIMGLYYGIRQYKVVNTTKNTKSNDTSLSKAVFNHTKEIISDIQPTIKNYKENHTESKLNNKSLTEDEIYEKVMIEIEEDKKVKSTWAKALAECDGDYKKAESLYIKTRFKVIYDEQIKDLEDNRINNQCSESTFKSKDISFKETNGNIHDISEDFNIAHKEYLKDYYKRTAQDGIIIENQSEEIIKVILLNKYYTCIGKDKYRKNGTDDIFKIKSSDKLDQVILNKI